MMKNLLFLFLFIIAVSGCKHKHGHPEPNETIPLYDTVMQIHDAVMPETATIHKIRKALKETKTDGDRSVILSQIQYLDEAEEAMMSWMAEFNVPEDKNQQTTYLNNERIKIQKVSDMMYDAIRKGRMVLDSIQAQ
jgi:hypothetical protein